MKTTVFFDLETGGLEPLHPITQIAAVAVQDGRIIAEFEAKMQFRLESCDPKALEINGYTESAWANAEHSAVVARRFKKFLEPFKCIEKTAKSGARYKVAQLAGYNAAVFDAPRLQKLYSDHGLFLPADYRILDTFQLAMWFFEKYPEGKPESLKLSSMCEYFGVPLDNAHDALADVIATAKLTEKLLSA